MLANVETCSTLLCHLQPSFIRVHMILSLLFIGTCSLGHRVWDLSRGLTGAALRFGCICQAVLLCLPPVSSSCGGSQTWRDHEPGHLASSCRALPTLGRLEHGGCTRRSLASQSSGRHGATIEDRGFAGRCPPSTLLTHTHPFHGAEGELLGRCTPETSRCHAGGTSGGRRTRSCTGRRSSPLTTPEPDWPTC